MQTLPLLHVYEYNVPCPKFYNKINASKKCIMYPGFIYTLACHHVHHDIISLTP